MIDVREHTTKVEQEAARVAAGSPVPTTGPSFPLPTLPLTRTHTHTRTMPFPVFGVKHWCLSERVSAPVDELSERDAMAAAMNLIEETVSNKRAVTMAAVRDLYEETYTNAGGTARISKMNARRCLSKLVAATDDFWSRVVSHDFLDGVVLVGRDLTVGQAAAADNHTT